MISATGKLRSAIAFFIIVACVSTARAQDHQPPGKPTWLPCTDVNCLDHEPRPTDPPCPLGPDSYGFPQCLPIERGVSIFPIQKSRQDALDAISADIADKERDLEILKNVRDIIAHEKEKAP